MSRRCLVMVLCLTVSLVILTSCNSGEPQKEPENNQVSATPTESTQPTVTSSPTPLATPTEDPDPQIIWAETPFLGITEEAQDLIRIRLKEKGIDCRIEFISSEDKLGTEYKSWLDKMNRGNKAPDIISAGLWEHGIFDAVAFEESEMIPLNDYLLTEEGRALYEAYAEVEWDRTEVHGKYYTVPERLPFLNEVYLYVNNQYKDVFDSTFDGTYESIRNLCSTIPSSSVIATSFGTKILYAFEDCASSFSVSFNLSTQEFTDLTKQDSTKEYLQMVWSDYRSGLMVRVEVGEDLPSNTLVFIGTEKPDQLEGYTEIVWKRDLCLAAPALSYGVSASSQHQDLALRILGMCYSDPEIASLLCWRVPDEKRWAERTKYLESCAENSLAGFLPEITGEQYLALQQYDSDISTLCTKMFVYRNGVWMTNEHYPEYLDLFFSNPKEYKDMSGTNVFDKLNKQYAKWLESQ